MSELEFTIQASLLALQPACIYNVPKVEKMKTTLTYFCLLSVVLSVAAGIAEGQDSGSKQSHEFVVMPRDVGLPLIVVQPGSPLEFVEAQLLLNLGTRLWTPSFRLRNCGTKPLRAFTVAAAGTGEWGWKAQDANQYLMPGQTLTLEEDNRDQIVTLTDGLRDKLGLRGPLKGLVALVVIDAEYADGARFHESGYEPLSDYLETVRGVLRYPQRNAASARARSHSVIKQ